MKLIRFGGAGREKPGLVLEDGTRVDASGFGEDYDEDFFGSRGPARLKAWLKKRKGKLRRVGDGLRLGPPVARPSKIVCVGLNYTRHALETKAAVPKEPVLFFKSTTALAGPNDDLVLPRDSQKTDWEVELAVVIGKEARYVDEAAALKHVAGFCLHNDYSERAFQLERGGQWVKGKSCDTFAPLGPWLATPDEIADCQNLGLWLKVNGETMQDSSTSDMIFKVPFLVSYISRFMTLLPGDVVSTGTPQGVALGMATPRYLKAGDRVELGIEGLGVSAQRVRAPKLEGRCGVTGR